MSFKFSQRSLNNLATVQPALQAVAHRALELTSVDFIVTEGIRTRERQEQLVASGASTTMNSRHLTGHALDVAAYADGEVRWDWPLYDKIAEAFKQAAYELDVDITWGGDWKSFKDGPHYELSWDKYPANEVAELPDTAMPEEEVDDLADPLEAIEQAERWLKVAKRSLS